MKIIHSFCWHLGDFSSVTKYIELLHVFIVVKLNGLIQSWTILWWELIEFYLWGRMRLIWWRARTPTYFPLRRRTSVTFPFLLSLSPLFVSSPQKPKISVEKPPLTVSQTRRLGEGGDRFGDTLSMNCALVNVKISEDSPWIMHCLPSTKPGRVQIMLDSDSTDLSQKASLI